MTNLQDVCYGIVSTFFVASTLTILLRIYSRGFVVKSFGWDDWFMSAILLFNCGQQVLLYYFLHYGGGLHFKEVLTTHPENIQKLITALFVEEIYYVAMHWIIKMAFLLFYLRFATKTFRKLVYITIFLNCAFTVAQWLLYCLQCMPLGAFFHPAAHPNVKCINNKVLAFVPAALNIFTDICIVILPIQPLWSIQISLRKRLLLLSIISLGGIVVLISILRLTVLLEFQKMTDFTYSLGKIIIISCIELEVAIMAANAPSLKIFFGSAMHATSQGGSGSGGPNDNKLGYSRRDTLTQSRPKFGTTSSTCQITSKGGMQVRDLQRGENPSSSEESLTRKDSPEGMGILVTSVVGVETHEVRKSQHYRGRDEYEMC